MPGTSVWPSWCSSMPWHRKHGAQWSPQPRQLLPFWQENMDLPHLFTKIPYSPGRICSQVAGAAHKVPMSGDPLRFVSGPTGNCKKTPIETPQYECTNVRFPNAVWKNPAARPRARCHPSMFLRPASESPATLGQLTHRMIDKQMLPIKVTLHLRWLIFFDLLVRKLPLKVESEHCLTCNKLSKQGHSICLGQARVKEKDHPCQ